MHLYAIETLVRIRDHEFISDSVGLSLFLSPMGLTNFFYEKSKHHSLDQDEFDQLFRYLMHYEMSDDCHGFMPEFKHPIRQVFSAKKTRTCFAAWRANTLQTLGRSFFKIDGVQHKQYVLPTDFLLNGEERQNLFKWYKDLFAPATKKRISHEQGQQAHR
jgi:hypothetical protein